MDPNSLEQLRLEARADLASQQQRATLFGRLGRAEWHAAMEVRLDATITDLARAVTDAQGEYSHEAFQADLARTLANDPDLCELATASVFFRFLAASGHELDQIPDPELRKLWAFFQDEIVPPA